ncbi:hypothetical protein [Planktothrix agardhii]|jgi:hypothetical protein|uniref:hypothetical protein n=1 Tax=Planktothrix agardhii TaxID=1160 RepID=UPI0020A6FD97|nr:hypothetical protein [Planktothrix agardhii]CAD5944076.1 hypothetical protein NO365_02112 [Planktothrix agardhii]
MSNYKVVFKRIVSPDGKVIAEAKSVVSTSEDQENKISQSVSVNISSVNGSSQAKSSSSSSSTSSYPK